MSDRETVQRYIAAVRGRVDALRQRARAGKSDSEQWPAEVLEELFSALDELQASEQRLRAQGEQLAAAREEMEAEKGHYRELIRSAPDAHLVTDAEGVIREANAAAGRLLGMRADRLCGRPMSAFVDDHQPDELRAELLRRAHATRPGEWELRLRARGGRVVPVVGRVLALRDPAGELRSLRWILHDVSGRREAEARELRLAQEHAARETAEAARAQIEAILAHLPVGVVIAEAPSGRILTYNRPVEEIFGFPPPLADSVAEYSEIYLGLHPDGRPYEPEEWPLARAVGTGEVVVGQEIELVRMDGGRRVCRVSAAPVRDADGRIVAGVATLSDVTQERRRATMEHFLAEVSDTLSSSLDHQTTVQRLAELCAESLADYCIVHVEEASGIRGLGVAHSDPARESAVRAVLRSVPVDSASDHPVTRAIRTGESQLLPEISEDLVRRLVPRPEQQELILGLRLSSALVVPLRSGGRPLGAITLARAGRARPFDEQDREVAEAVAMRAVHAVDNARLYREARNAARARDDIIRVVSHDLRNSLNAALMNTDLLLEVAPVFEAGSRERRQMEAVRRSLDHMHRLVQDLLEVDRIERGRLSVSPARFRPEALEAEIPELFSLLAEEAAVGLEVVIPASLPAVLADHARLVQVLGNLIANAVRHTPRGGRVTVVAAERGDEVQFRVTDTGVGIAPEDLPRVFDRFYQGSAARGGGGGSGLGLTIARGIIEAHGGRMGVESRPGEGSTFWFTLPRAREA